MIFIIKRDIIVIYNITRDLLGLYSITKDLLEKHNDHDKEIMVC